MAEQEQWRIVVGFPDYEVSNFGRVRRGISTQGRRAGKAITPKAPTKTATAMFQLQCGAFKRMVNAKKIFRNAWPELPCPEMNGEWAGQIKEQIKAEEGPRKPAVPKRSLPKGETARYCRDCGAPTTDYRCQLCWRILRGEVEGMDQADYGAGVDGYVQRFTY